MSDDLKPNGNIRKLWPADVELYRDHLLRLDTDTRHLRFACAVSDGYIKDYAAHMTDSGNVVYGYLDHGSIRAVAEIKPIGDDLGLEAEAAFSVEPDYQNQGLGTKLMGRVIRTARNRGIHTLFMSCLVENAKMQQIARHHHADLRFEFGEVVGEIIPKQADYFSYISEVMEDRTSYMLAVFDLQSRLISRVA